MYIAFIVLLGIVVWILCGAIAVIINGYVGKHFDGGCDYDDRIRVFMMGPLGLVVTLLMSIVDIVIFYVNNNEFDLLDKLYEIGYGKDDDEN